MEQSMQKKLKKIILEFLQDGRERNIDEIKQEVQRQGIELEKNSSMLRTALFYLKKENSAITNPQKGIYRYVELEKERNPEKGKSKYNFEDFETIGASTRKSICLVVSIFADGTFALNSKLLEFFPEQKAEIKLKNDGSEMALIASGKTFVNFGKNGRIKNYKIVEKLQDRKIKLPAYYVGEWDAEEKVWLGKVMNENPNYGRKKSAKAK